MFNKIAKTIEKETVEVDKKRMTDVIEKVVDVFNNEMVTMAEKIAKSLCNQCPLKWMCRDYAIKSNQPYGIWGGLSAQDRKLI